MKRIRIVVWVGVVLSAVAVNASTLFSETFGSLSDGTAITTANTSFTYARTGTGAGAYLNAFNPGNLSGASGLLLATSTSLTGLGATNGSYGAFDVGTLQFSFHTPDSFGNANSLYVFVGSGNTFSGNSLFSSGDLTAGLAIVAGQLQTRNSLNAWENVGAPLTPDTSYDLSLVFNGSALAVSYGADSVAAGTADIWLNGALFGDDVSIRDAQSTSAFRLYTTGSAADAPFEIDNVKLYDAAMPVPEPSSALLLLLGTCAALSGWLRKA